MKKTYILCVFFIGFLLSNVSFAQVAKVEATYNVKVQKKNSTDNLSERMQLVLKEVENIVVQFSYNNGKASFKTDENTDLDYMTSLNRSSAKTIAGVRDSYYYNIPKKEVVTDRELWGTRYNIVYNLDHYTWELHDETKTIYDYQCYKATTTHSYKNRKGTISTFAVTAWYSPQIPIPLGPKNYTGLPGLVLELHEGPRTIYITTLVLNSDKEIIITKPPRGKEVTEAEFEKIAAQAYSNYMDARKNE